jgi:beta-xylosidase
VRPAIGSDFADPDVIRVGVTWWAYATGTGFADLQVRSSPDLVSWSAPVDPLPRLPAWAIPGFSWAPAVAATRNGFLMYYSARDAAYGRQCLSVASSATPSGPFVDASTGPMACQTSVGGSIDPAPFTAADGTSYLLWKSDNNALGRASRIGVQRLSPDGLSLVGDRPGLLTATERWQGGVIEGPSMVAAQGRLYLFYGANDWDTAAAGIGYAICAGPTGPCTDEALARPWLGSAPGGFGPSGPDVFMGADGRDWIAFHAWNADPEGVDAVARTRQLWILPLTFVDGRPVIG